ncbi:MAG: HAD family hydrolase [Pseudomonadota bacterium]
MTHPAVEAVLFDKDGTLFDFDATWAVWAGDALRALGSGDEDLTARLAETMEYDLEAGAFRPTSTLIAGTLGEQAEALLAHLPGEDLGSLTTRMIELAKTVTQVEVVPLAPLLAGLRGQGLKLGVATNDAEASARAHLATVNVLEAFDFIAGYDSGYGGKPAPGQLLGFAEAMDVDPARTLMVGDSTHDLAAARAAGMVPVGVLTGPATEATLAPHAAVVLPSIAALPGWIATIGG